MYRVVEGKPLDRFLKFCKEVDSGRYSGIAFMIMWTIFMLIMVLVINSEYPIQ